MDLFDLDAARAEARSRLAAAVADADVDVGEYQAWTCTIRDAQDVTLLRIIIAALVEKHADPRDGTRTFQPA